LKRLQKFWKKLQARDMRLSKDILKVAENQFYSNHEEILANSKSQAATTWLQLGNVAG
jgi:hypothetical protein